MPERRIPVKTLFSVKNISIAYEGKKILENISFDVFEGDFLVIFGENGSGKSSLVKTVLSLKEPVSGKIEFSEGFNIYETGYLPQTTKFQADFPASVGEIVVSGFLNRMKNRPFYGKKEKEIADKNMELTGIKDLKKQSFKTLSGGQQQRVLLARALCAAQKLVVLDEPTAGLDPSATADFYDMICKINQKGIAVIMVSHDVHSALSVSKHVLRLGSSGILFYGTPLEYEKKEAY